MKTIKFLKLTIVAILTLTVVSCVDSDEYDVPPIADQIEPNVTVNSSIGAIKSAVNQEFNSNQEAKVIFDGDSDLVLEGYVISSDYAGNFFRSITIQDSPENPTHGIEVLINKTSLFENYEIGRKVYIKMASLSAIYEDGEDNDPTDSSALGRYVIGKNSGGFGLDNIPLFSYLESVLRSTETATIVPTAIALSDISEEHINTFIQLNDMQFRRRELGKTFSGEPADQFDGFRRLVSCVDGVRALLQTSTFADFSSYTLSENVGTINAVLAKDFRADLLVLSINSPTDIDFTSPDRCDPVVLECTGTSGGSTTIFSENFESFSNYTAEGWTNVNVSGTSIDWFISGFGGNTYSRISAFSSNVAEANAWLVTPSIDLDSTTGEELTFDVQASFDNGTILTAYISTDFTGDPTTATWQLLDADIPSGPSGGFGDFENSGNINISCLDGTVNIGFFYEGSDATIEETTRYHIDNVEVTGN